VTGNLTTLIILVTLLHVAAFAVMIMIRLRRDEARGPAGGTATITPCAAHPPPTWATTGSTRTSGTTRTPAGLTRPTMPTISRCAPPTDTTHG